MQIIFIILTITFTIAISKYAVINSLSYKSQAVLNPSIGFLIFPYLFFNKSPDGIIKNYYKDKTIYFIEIFSIIIAAVYSLIIIKIALLNSNPTTMLIVYLVFLTFVHFSLSYLSVYDLLTLSIPSLNTKILLLVSIIISIVFSTFQLLPQSNLEVNIFLLGSPGNLLGFFISFFYSFSLVRISKEKFMGEGDIFVFGVIGLILGLQLSVIFLLLFPILGSAYGLVNSLLFNKFKTLLIPLVPVLYFTFLLILFYKEQLRVFLGF